MGPVAKARHGYRVHTDMIRFWWKAQTVEEQLAMLEDEEECGHAWDAYQRLVADPESSYGRFVAMHQTFLRRNRAQIQVDERRLQLPRRALEEEGLECAVWPHLYPKTAWCETHVRLQDVRRKESRHGRARSRRRTQPAAAAATVVAAAAKHCGRTGGFGASCHDTPGWSRGCMEREGPEEEETEEAAPLFPSPWPAGMGSAFAVLGPAGSGKTTAVHQAIQEAVNNGARVLTHGTHWQTGCDHAGKVPRIGSGHRPWSLPRLQAGAGNVGAHVAL